MTINIITIYTHKCELTLRQTLKFVLFPARANANELGNADAYGYRSFGRKSYCLKESNLQRGINSRVYLVRRKCFSTNQLWHTGRQRKSFSHSQLQHTLCECKYHAPAALLSSENHGSTLDPKQVWTQWQKHICRGFNPRPLNSVEMYRPMWRKWPNDCQQLEGHHQKSAHVISTFKRVLSNFVQLSSSKRLA